MTMQSLAICAFRLSVSNYRAQDIFLISYAPLTGGRTRQRRLGPRWSREGLARLFQRRAKPMLAGSAVGISVAGQKFA
jgi:hypothetical protein